jgi:antitoxin ParD1/3/4
MEVNMANVEKISISMTPQHAEILRDAVKSGAYASGSEVIREAMRDWSAKWAQKRDDISKLRELWAEGKASGTATEVDFDQALDEARAELTAFQKHDR